MLTPSELVWLLAAVAKRDQVAFERLYSATKGKLYGVVLRILRRQDLADEVIQETYVKVWNNASQFDPSISTPITWMVAIARNRAIDLVRKKTETSIEEESEAMEVAAETPDPLAQREMTEELKRLLGCMGALDPERQRLVLLAYYSGWSREQLATEFDKPVNTIKTWLRRSLMEDPGVSWIMTHDEDQEALAAEYVLGTLDADERAQAQTLIGIDKSFADVVRRWERRLGELHLMVDAVDPPANTWEHIKAGIAPLGEGSVAGPEEIKADVAPAPVVPPPSADGNVVDLTRRFTRWRGAAVGMGALAASLAALLVAVEVAPERLPAPLRPPSRGIETVAGGRFVAVLQRDAASPAFLLTVDVDQRSMTVRRVDAQREPGKSYELWLVSNQFPQPRSLGVVDNEFTTSQALAAYDPNTISDATYAVTLEPEGGSPTGFATGPVLWAGKLVEAAPPPTTRSP